MPIASTDEQFALQSSIREWAKRAATIEVVRSQETDGRRGPGCGFAALGEPG